MEIIYSEVIPASEEPFIYSISGEVVTATYKGVTDTFDFSGMPVDSVLTYADVETELEEQPVLSASRDANGVLQVELLQFKVPEAGEGNG